MSTHKSLKSERFPKIRSVRTRRERLAKLKRTEKWIEGMSAYGLPKEKILRLKLKIKDEKKKVQLEGLAELAMSVNDEKKKKKTSRDVTGIR